MEPVEPVVPVETVVPALPVEPVVPVETVEPVFPLLKFARTIGWFNSAQHAPRATAMTLPILTKSGWI